MMRFTAILVILSVFACAVLAEKCDSNLSPAAITTETATFGCDGGVSRSYDLTWVIKPSPSGADRLLYATGECVPGSYHKLVVSQGDATYTNAPCYRTNANPIVINGKETVYVKWTGQYSEAAKYKFIVEAAPADYSTILSGQIERFKSISSGAGYAYFGIRDTNGKDLHLDFTIRGYDGMTKPTIFASSLGELPTMTRFGFKNDSVCTGTTLLDCRLILRIPNPASGQWTAGIYVTGRYYELFSYSRWLYNATVVTNGARTERTGLGDAFYQITVPRNARNLNVKLARSPPGGNTNLYIGTGFAPSYDYSSYKLSVHNVDFDQVDIANPYNDKAANPGLFILRTVPSGSSVGSVFQVSYTF